jgi:hypothetical protein
MWPLQASMAQTQTDWVEVGANETGTQFYALAHELVPPKTSSAEPTFWVKQKPSPGQGLGWYEGHALYRLNCLEKSYKILKVSLFYSDGTNQSHSGEEVVRHIIPQTPLADVAARLCPSANSSSGQLSAASTGATKL